MHLEEQYTSLNIMCIVVAQLLVYSNIMSQPHPTQSSNLQFVNAQEVHT